MSSSVRGAISQPHLSQLLEEVLFPVVEIVKHLRPSRVAFSSRNESFPAVLGDKLIDKFWNALIRLDPITISATEYRILDVRER